MENSSFSALPIGTVSAVFFSKEDAKKTHDYLISLGHSDEEISMLMSDETLNKFQMPDAENSPQVQEPSPSYQKFLRSYADKFLSWLRLKKHSDQITGAAELSEQASGNPNKLPDGSDLMDEKQPGSLPIPEGGIIISVDPKNIVEMGAIIDVFKKNNGKDILGNDGYSKLD